MPIRIKETEIPTFSALGFQKQCEYSWPYNPCIKLFETHMEMHFLDYKQSVLDLRIPNNEAMKKRWWKLKFRAFIRKELRGLKLSHYNFIPSEEAFFEDYPHLRNKWELKRTSIVLRESRNDRFGKSRSDFDHHLRLTWIIDKKYEFMMRWLGLRTVPSTRRQDRLKFFHYYSDSLLFCHHSQCWKERTKKLPILLIVWIFLQIYYFWNSNAFDIQLKTNSKKESVEPN